MSDNPYPTIIRGDVVLVGMSWANNGRDVDLCIDHRDVGPTVIRLSWAGPVSCRLQSSGPPLSWEGGVTRKAGGRCVVAFDFGSAGDLEVECEDIAIVSGSPAP